MDPQTQAVQTLANPTPLDQGNQIFQKILAQNRQLAEQASQPQGSQQAAISQAMGKLSSKDPMGAVGKAIATPNYAGYCLQWVDDQQGNKNRQPTAYADYQANAQQGNINQSSDNIPKGARVYFSPDQSNGNMGHVGISNGDGTFTSATDNGVQTFSLADWEKYTGQKYLGYAG